MNSCRREVKRCHWQVPRQRCAQCRLQRHASAINVPASSLSTHFPACSSSTHFPAAGISIQKQSFSSISNCNRPRLSTEEEIKVLFVLMSATINCAVNRNAVINCTKLTACRSGPCLLHTVVSYMVRCHYQMHECNGVIIDCF